MAESWTIYVCRTCGWWFGDGDTRREPDFRVWCDEGLDGPHPEVEMEAIEVVTKSREDSPHPEDVEAARS